MGAAAASKRCVWDDDTRRSVKRQRQECDATQLRESIEAKKRMIAFLSAELHRLERSIAVDEARMARLDDRKRVLEDEYDEWETKRRNTRNVEMPEPELRLEEVTNEHDDLDEALGGLVGMLRSATFRRQYVRFDSGETIPLCDQGHLGGDSRFTDDTVVRAWPDPFDSRWAAFSTHG